MDQGGGVPLEVGGEDLAAVPEVVALDSKIGKLGDCKGSSGVQVPTRDCARLGAGVAFALRVGCSRRMYTASRAGNNHWVLGIWFYQESHPRLRTLLYSTG